MSCTIHDLLIAGPQKDEDIAIKGIDRKPLSNGRLRGQVRGVVARLNALGYGRNDRIVLCLPNGPEMAVAFLAVAAGFTCLPASPEMTPDEFDRGFSGLPPPGLDRREGDPAGDRPGRPGTGHRGAGAASAAGGGSRALRPSPGGRAIAGRRHLRDGGGRRTDHFNFREHGYTQDRATDAKQPVPQRLELYRRLRADRRGPQPERSAPALRPGPVHINAVFSDRRRLRRLHPRARREPRSRLVQRVPADHVHSGAGSARPDPAAGHRRKQKARLPAPGNPLGRSPP